MKARQAINRIKKEGFKSIVFVITTPANITELKPNEIFVFGSNLNGNHIGGAARFALEKFGAVEGEGRGLFGQSYAFPTLGHNMKPLSVKALEVSKELLYAQAAARPDLTFYLTRVGTGIAGIDEKIMKSLFTQKLDNIFYPEGW